MLNKTITRYLILDTMEIFLLDDSFPTLEEAEAFIDRQANTELVVQEIHFQLTDTEQYDA